MNADEYFKEHYKHPEIQMIVNAHFLKEMEQGSIKDCR